ncbi:hypothetical protein CHUAL_007158 [Chamberlinius hualienensis]
MLILISATILMACYMLICFFDYILRNQYVSNFKNKRVFITGCDSGFGNALAITLDKMGLYVYAGCHRQDGADELQAKTSSRLKTVILDITDQNSVDKAKQFIESDLPPGINLWGLINNAGIIGNLIFGLSDNKDFRKTMEVNFFGSIRVTEAFVSLIKKSKGRIINVSSIAGRMSIGVEAYTSSKHALTVYTDGLRRSMTRYGVKVSTIEPSYCMNTSILNDGVMQDLKNKFDNITESNKAEYEKGFFNTMQKIYTFHKSKSFMHKWLFCRMISMDIVIKSMTNALGSKRPKSRYTVGILARPILFVTNIMPDWMLDNVLYAISL